MTWPERTREQIDFISPQKKYFSGFWAKSTQSIEKSLAIFKYPKVKGVVVQDLDVGGDRHLIPFWFEGSDHDLQAQAFLQAIRENGTWKVTHPVLDKLTVHPVTVSCEHDPTGNGNISSITSEWLEPAPKDAVISIEEDIANLNAQADLTNETSAGQFDRFVSQENASLRNSVVVASQSLLDRVNAAMATLNELNAQINSYINSIQRAINNLFNVAVLDVLALANQFQQLIQLPMLATNDIEARLDAVRNLSDSIFDLTPDTYFQESLNTTLVMELGISACITAAGQSVPDANLRTRREALDAAAIISDLFISNTDRLDEIQKIFEDQYADRQYFSQSESFADATILSLRAVDLLIRESFDLRVEKRIKLDKARAPVEIALTEYDGPGENDANFDFFIETNQLSGDEIMLLEAGREVVVYV